MTVPGLLRAPAPVMVQQWRTVFERGKVTAPPLAGFALANFLYLSYRHYNTALPSLRAKWPHYLVAGLSALAIIPYTLVAMRSVNEKLIGHSNEAGFAVTAASSTTADDKEDEDTAATDAQTTASNVSINEASAKQLVDSWGMLNLGRSVFPLLGAAVGLWAMT